LKVAVNTVWTTIQTVIISKKSKQHTHRVIPLSVLHKQTVDFTHGVMLGIKINKT